MSKNRNIVVFWIDEAPREDFLTRLRDAGIQAFTADNYVDGVQWLSNPKNIEICDAVILDVNCKIRHSDEHESTDSFRDYAYRVLSRCEEDDKHIPWFVFTTGSGYDESLLNAIPQREWTRRRFYRKDTDQQQLINDIRELTKHSGNVALRDRYDGIFELFEDEGNTHPYDVSPFSSHLSPSTFHVRLYDIIKKMEDPQNTTDTTVFNAMRKLMAFAVSYGRGHGLFSEDIDSIRAAEKRLADIYELAPQIVPSYILTNFRSLSDTVNNGSHSRLEEEEAGSLAVDADVLSGKAPYLARTAFYQLMTLLNWLRRLPVDPAKIATLRERIDAMLDNPVEMYEGCECYLQFDNGVWHYGRCAVRPRPGHTVSGQTLIRLKNVQPNKNYLTKKQYPFFAQYDVVMTRL